MVSNAIKSQVTLCISIVTYKNDADVLETMFSSLEIALRVARQEYPISTSIIIIDNSENDLDLVESLRLVSRSFEGTATMEIITNKVNSGYAAAQNQGIQAARAEFCLLMNPDIVLAPDALLNALECLKNEPEVVAISPEVKDENGNYQYLCKRYPSLLVLLLRGFAPEWLKETFHDRLARYEYKLQVDNKINSEVELISGCFMFCRTSALRGAGGFNEEFFMYFEDFALSIELSKIGKLFYCPQVCIVHHGGYAAKKGLRHIRYFIGSAVTFFKRYGWKFC